MKGHSHWSIKGPTRKQTEAELVRLELLQCDIPTWQRNLQTAPRNNPELFVYCLSLQTKTEPGVEFGLGAEDDVAPFASKNKEAEMTHAHTSCSTKA